MPLKKVCDKCEVAPERRWQELVTGRDENKYRDEEMRTRLYCEGRYMDHWKVGERYP